MNATSPTTVKDPLDNFFSPKRVAIVGASSKPGKIGHELVRNISQYQFKGVVYPVNPNAETILGLKCYPSISQIRDQIDLAVYVAPSNVLPDLVEEAGKQGVKNAIIVSGGFKEMGEDKAVYQEQLVSAAHKHGIRIIGPNCIGVFDSVSRLDTFFYPHDRMARPKPGGVSFVTQSGTFGLTFLEWANNSSLGIRRLVSLGNRCDVSEVELIRYLGQDPLTKVIAVHLESLSDGRSLIKEVREASMKKPILLLKTGRIEGSKAAKSHTGAITGSYQVCKSILANSGSIITESFEDLFDLSKAIEKQPIAKGKNVTIVTNAAGPSVAAADLLHEMGLTITKYNEEKLKNLQSSLPSYAVIGEYVDLTGSATSEDYEKTFQIILTDPNIDAILNFVVFLNPPLTTEVVNIISKVQGHGIPIISWATGGEFSQSLIRKLEEGGVPTYPTSERAVKAVAGLIAAGRKKQWTSPGTINVQREIAEEIIKRALSEDRDMLTEIESKNILRVYGIRTTTEYLAKTTAEAITHASRLEFPVVLKVLSPDISHKSDVGGVITNLMDTKEVADAFEKIMNNVRNKQPEARIDGVLVENQLPQGIELIIGSTIDRDFGPVIAFGPGGLFVELFRELTYGLAPLSINDAFDIISSTKARKLLKGIRGHPPADLNKLADLMVRASFLSFEQPIAEMDLNPVIASANDCAAADARIRVRVNG